jgi:hypothetical protein
MCLPVHPGSYLRDIRDRVQPGEALDARRFNAVRQRQAQARDYGIVAMLNADSLLQQAVHEDLASARD